MTVNMNDIGEDCDWDYDVVSNCNRGLDPVADMVAHRPPIRKVGSLIHGRVKPVTYKIYTCHFLALCLTSL